MRVYSVLDAVRDDHNRIVGMLNALLAPGKDAKKKKDQYRDLRRELTVHTLFEEETVYPRVRQFPSLTFLASLGAAHHKSIDTYINRLDRIPFGSPNWLFFLQKLREDTVHHMRIEERELAGVLKLVPFKARSRAC